MCSVVAGSVLGVVVVQESFSQQDSQESDWSLPKKRRHRKKRPRNRIVPLSTPSPTAPPSLPGTASIAAADDVRRKGSFTSRDTNQSLTNVSNNQLSSQNTSRVQSSNNTSRVPSSDEGRVTPEPARPTTQPAQSSRDKHSEVAVVAELKHKPPASARDQVCCLHLAEFCSLQCFFLQPHR